MSKPKTKEWLEEENKELLEFMEEGRKKGLQIRYLCEQFAKRDPQLTREQVRSHYYQLLNSPDKSEGKFRQGPWTEEEDNFLFNSIKEKSKEMNKLEIFEYVGMKLNRNPRAVASHYYNIEKIRKQNEDEELDKFIYGISRLDIEKIDNILNKLKEIHKYSNKEKEILKLEMKIKNMEKQIEDLTQQITDANNTIKSYENKFENFKKVYGNTLNI
jgi:uncharacterized coiled-coil protein SlyX